MEERSGLEEELKALSNEEREHLKEMLSSLADGDRQPVSEFLHSDYDEIPVDILTFINEDRYLGRALKNPDGTHRIYKYWQDALVEIFESDCVEVIITGPIGSGKTTIIEVGLAYNLYETLCLRDPFEFFQLVRAQPICFLFFSLSKDLSHVGLFRGFMELLVHSSWFRERGILRGVRDRVLGFPQKNIEYSLGSPKMPGYGIVGRNIIAGGLDEISEITTVKELESKDSFDLTKMKALRIYEQTARRMESRFLRGGHLPGKLFLASSKQDEAAFLERYIERVKGSPYALVFDAPIWDIKPKEFFSGVTFPVAVGDRFRGPKVLVDGESLADYESQGYDIINPPIEYKRSFDLDVVGALRDIAGITASGTRRSKLIPRAEYIESCVDEQLVHPFTRETVYLGTEDEIGLEDFFDSTKLQATSHPRYIHVDLGLTGDAAGMAMCYISGQRTVDKVLEDGSSVSVEDDIVTFDFVVQIANIEGSEIPFWKIRRFILFLRSKNFPIAVVTFDGWMSVDCKQLLRRSGFDSEILSVDRNDEPYLAVRSAVYETRVRFWRHPVLIQELMDVEHDRRRKKVDHPSGGSKDVSDAVAGALFMAQQRSGRVVAPSKMVEALRELRQERGGGERDIQWFLKHL